MMILSLCGAVLALAAANWVVVKAPAWLRVVFFSAVLCVSIDLAYTIGRGWQKMYFLGTHIRSFERYSALLSNLAKDKRYDELAEDVVIFDRRWSADIQSPVNIDCIVTELESNRTARSLIPNAAQQ